jgi:hypothetical protein
MQNTGTLNEYYRKRGLWQFLLQIDAMSQVVDVLEYLGESVLVLNDGGPLSVQQGGADQQVEVLARLFGPQHLPEQ